MDKMTDAEIVCGFMEPDAENRIDSDFEWWGQIWTNGKRAIYPRTLDLDALHEVEARLTEEQWDAYGGEFDCWRGEDPETVDHPFLYRALLHATAEQKLAALARVISGQNVSQ